MIRAKSALAARRRAWCWPARWPPASRTPPARPPGPRPPIPARTTWVGSWGSVPTTVPRRPAPPMFSNQTIRQTVHLSIGGSTLQVRFSNEFGTAPLVIGEAHVGLAAGSEPSRSVAPGSDRRLSFAGHVSATCPRRDAAAQRPGPAGGAARRRPGGQPLPAAADQGHDHALRSRCQENVVAAGNVTGSRTVTPTATFGQWRFLSGVSAGRPGPRRRRRRARRLDHRRRQHLAEHELPLAGRAGPAPAGHPGPERARRAQRGDQRQPAAARSQPAARLGRRRVRGSVRRERAAPVRPGRGARSRGPGM